MAIAIDQRTRRSGYKRTGLGLIPEAWEVKSLFAVAPLQRGFDLPTHKLREGNIPVVYSNGVLNYHDKAMVRGPGVVTGRSGTIGRVHYIEDDYWPHNTTLWVTNFYENIPKFVYYLYQFVRLDRLGAGSGVPTLNRNDVHRSRVAMPPRLEQYAIAAALSDTDSLIASLDKLIAKKRQIKQGVMQQLLTGKRRLSGFRGKWETKKLGELLEYEQPTRYLVKATEYSDEYDTPVLTAGKTFILGYTNEEIGIFKTLPVIIFDDFTTASKYVTFEFKAKSSAMKILKLRNDNINLRFIFEKMQLVPFDPGEHKRYWISEYQHLEIEAPEPAEQAAIAAVLFDMDAEIAALEAQRNKTGCLKQSMMQQLLTGNIRLV